MLLCIQIREKSRIFLERENRGIRDALPPHRIRIVSSACYRFLRKCRSETPAPTPAVSELPRDRNRHGGVDLSRWGGSAPGGRRTTAGSGWGIHRSEEHTSELQSP